MNPRSVPGTRYLRAIAGALVSLSRERRGLTYISVAVLVFLGLTAFQRLPRDLPPSANPVVVAVDVSDPGIPVEVMETRVTNVLEAALAPLPWLAHMSSSTREGESHVELQVAAGTGVATARDDVHARLAMVAMPIGADPPQISVPPPAPAVELVITSAARNPAALHAWAADLLKQQLITLSGVAALRFDGGGRHEIDVFPEQRKLAGAGLSLNGLIAAVRAAGQPPAGAAQHPTQIVSAAGLAALPLQAPDGEAIALSEVARVEDVHVAGETRVYHRGLGGIRVRVLPLAGARIQDVAQRVTAHLSWMQVNGLIPSDINVSVAHDAAATVGDSVRAGTRGARLGLVVAVVLLLVLVRGARRVAALISTVLVSVFGGACLLYVTRQALDAYTLTGLGLGALLAVGHGLRNFDRRALEGRDAAASYPLESGTALALSLPLGLLVFALTGGLVGELYRGFFIALGGAWITALLLALTWVPALAPSRTRLRPNRLVEWLVRQARERRARLSWQIGLTVAFAMIAALLWQMIRELPKSASLSQAVLEFSVAPRNAEQQAYDIERRVRDLGVAREVYTILTAVPSPSSAVSVQTVIELAPGSTAVTLEALRRRFEREGLAPVLTLHGADGVTNAFAVELRGADLNAFGAATAAVRRQLTGIAGVQLLPPQRTLVHGLAAQVDAARAQERGIDPIEAERAFRIARTGPVVTTLFGDEQRTAVRVRLPVEEGALLDGRVLLAGELTDRPAVYLRDVATVAPASRPLEIRHVGRDRTVDVPGVLSGERPRAAVLSQIRRALTGTALAPSVAVAGIDFGGAHASASRPVLALGLMLSALWVSFAYWFGAVRSWPAFVPGVALLMVAGAEILWPGPMQSAYGVWAALAMLGLYAAAGWLLVAEAGAGPGASARRQRAALSAYLLSAMLPAAAAVPLWFISGAADFQRPVGLAVTFGAMVCFAGNLATLAFRLGRRTVAGVVDDSNAG